MLYEVITDCEAQVGAGLPPRVAGDHGDRFGVGSGTGEELQESGFLETGAAEARFDDAPLPLAQQLGKKGG